MPGWLLLRIAGTSNPDSLPSWLPLSHGVDRAATLRADVVLPRSLFIPKSLPGWILLLESELAGPVHCRHLLPAWLGSGHSMCLPWHVLPGGLVSCGAVHGRILLSQHHRADAVPPGFLLPDWSATADSMRCRLFLSLGLCGPVGLFRRLLLPDRVCKSDPVPPRLLLRRAEAGLPDSLSGWEFLPSVGHGSFDLHRDYLLPRRSVSPVDLPRRLVLPSFKSGPHSLPGRLLL